MIVEGDQNDVESLTRQFERQRPPDARSGPRHERPRGAGIPRLQVGNRTYQGHVDLGQQVRDQPEGRREGEGVQDVRGYGLGERHCFVVFSVFCCVFGRKNGPSVTRQEKSFERREEGDEMAGRQSRVKREKRRQTESLALNAVQFLTNVISAAHRLVTSHPSLQANSFHRN